MAKILFCQEVYFLFHSTAKLSAYLKQAGHKVDLVIGDPKKIVAHARRTHPDLIAFSVFTLYRKHMLITAHAIKAAGILEIPIIAGGYDITFTPQILEYSALDIICRGEGEKPLAELCSRIDSGRDYTDIPNLWVKKDGLMYKNPMRARASNLDEFPIEDRDLYRDYSRHFKAGHFEQVLAGRGCPHACSFCFNPVYRKLYENEGSSGYCKLRSVDNLIEELLLLKEKYKAENLFFHDSTLTYNKAWLFDFLKKHKEKIRIPFIINAVISEIDEEVGRALAENGYCSLVKFGLETGNEDFRKNVLKKNITNKQLFEGTAILRKYGIRYSIHTMLGLPGETLELAWETIDMVRALSAKNSVHAFNLFEPFPGLEIAEYGVRLGQCKKEKITGKLREALQGKTDRGEDGKKDPERSSEGTDSIFFYEIFRSDPEGRRILKLSRFSYLVARFPWLRPLVEVLIKFPDNIFYRFIWHTTRVFWHIREHYAAPLHFFIKIALSTRQ